MGTQGSFDFGDWVDECGVSGGFLQVYDGFYKDLTRFYKDSVRVHVPA